MDIRNNVSQFNKLNNCTVIEGFLHIVLIDKADPKDYDKLSFPRLREITDYFVLFHVYGLHSLAHMFPNLAVIRGQRLIHNYALVVYSMVHLRELGLFSLKNITRGDVRIERNPNLCYVKTIDWTKIANNALINQNAPDDSCPYCPEACPSVGGGFGVNRLCWTQERCQEFGKFL